MKDLKQKIISILTYHVNELGENTKYGNEDQAVKVITALTELLKVIGQNEKQKDNA